MNFTPGTVLHPWVDPRVEMRLSPISGRGMFALRPIQPGETIIVWGGTVYTRADILAGKADPETIGILDNDLYLAEPVGAPVEEYNMNHSCDPNVWMQDAVTLVARRAIAPGEELTADYALWLYEQDWILDPCTCGSPLCRGRVTDKDWLLPELQQRFAGHFTPFLNKLIQQQKKH